MTWQVPALQGRQGGDSFGPAGVEQFLLRLSRLVVSHPEIAEILVNPLLVWDGRVMAREVRVTLHSDRAK
jgi:hypothetical protein